MSIAHKTKFFLEKTIKKERKIIQSLKKKINKIKKPDALPPAIPMMKASWKVDVGEESSVVYEGLNVGGDEDLHLFDWIWGAGEDDDADDAVDGRGGEDDATPSIIWEMEGIEACGTGEAAEIDMS